MNAIERWILPAAMVGGAALLIIGLTAERGPRRGPGAPIVVDGVPLGVEEIAAAARAAGARIEDVPSDALVERAIVDELVLRAGLELGLARTDPVIRRRLAQEVRNAAIETALAYEATDAELRAYHAAHADAFVRPPKVRVAQVFLRGERRAEIEAIHRRLAAGEPWSAVRTGSDPLPVAVEGRALDERAMAELFGARFRDAVFATAEGASTDPLRTAFGWHVARVVARTEGGRLDFETARAAVVSRERRDRSRRALKAYLDELRARADVQIAPDAAARVRAALETVPPAIAMGAVP